MNRTDLRFSLALTAEQALAVVSALDFYSRMAIGQFEEVALRVRMGDFTVYALPEDSACTATHEQGETVDALMRQVKETLGFPRNANLGVGSPHVRITGHRAYEVKKVLEREIVLARHSRESSIATDGLVVRYTEDPEPVVERVVSKESIS